MPIAIRGEELMHCHLGILMRLRCDCLIVGFVNVEWGRTFAEAFVGGVVATSSVGPFGVQSGAVARDDMWRGECLGCECANGDGQE